MNAIHIFVRKGTKSKRKTAQKKQSHATKFLFYLVMCILHARCCNNFIILRKKKFIGGNYNTSNPNMKQQYVHI